MERHETVRRPHLPRPHSSHRTGRLPPPHYHGSGRSRQGTNMALSLKKPRTICFSPVLTIFFYSTLTFKYVGWEKDKQNSLLKNRLATGNDIMKYIRRIFHEARNDKKYVLKFQSNRRIFFLMQ